MLLLAEHKRAFGYAVAASLALHALLLAMRLPALRSPEPPSPEPPLVARLAEPAPPAPPEALPPAVEKPQPPKPLPRRRAPTPEPRPKPILEAPSARPAPTIPAPSPSPEATESPPQPVPAPAVPSPTLAANVPAAAPAPDPAAERDRFRQDLIEKAGQYKRYPKMAVDNGWTGQVTVRIEVADNGSVASVRVKASSGNPVLDAQALETFRKAAPEVIVPPVLRGKAFAVEIPMIYNFKDAPG